MRTTLHLDLTTASDAVKASANARAQVHHLAVDHPERRSVLEAARDAMNATWTDDLREYTRSGPQLIGRVGDPVRKLATERRRELARIRSMLNPTSGTSPKAPPRVTTQQLNGHLGRARQRLYAIDNEHDAIRSALGSGSLRARSHGRGHYRSMTELNAEASRLLDDLATVRRNLTTQHQRWKRRQRGVGTYAQQDRRAAIEKAIVAFRRDCDVVAAELRASAGRTTPLSKRERRGAAPRQEWPQERIESALREYHQRFGHWPTAAELRTNPELPHYTQLGRLYGPRFLGRLDAALSTPATPKS
jgi:hypothetical protein